MNWYKRFIYAQGAEQYLASLGADQQVIEYILSNENNKQFLINEFRKNPGLTREQLENFIVPQKKNIDPYIEHEKRLAKNFELELPQFSKWILVSLRKLRKGLYSLDSQGNITYPFSNPNLTEEDHNRYTLFREKIGEIRDWIANINPDIASYSPEQAIAASDEWHRMMAGKGEGKYYEPINPELIVYGPEWKNTEWNGWTIQRVMSENDLSVEGNRMGHCVGSYCDEVQEGFSMIYSLRDPQNNPKVTMETDDFHNVKQIQGHSNSIPEKQYRAMIKEWIQSDKNENIEKYDYDSDPFAEISTSYGTADDILGAIEQVINDDYGLERETSTEAGDIMNIAIDLMNRNREPSYWGDFRYVPEAIIDMIIKVNKNNKELMIKKLKDFENELYEKEEEIWDWAYKNWDMGSFGEYPKEENYETQEEFEKAEEEYKNQESEYMDEEIRKTPYGGFAGDGIKYINKLREEGIIPSYDETRKIEEEF